MQSAQTGTREHMHADTQKPKRASSEVAWKLSPAVLSGCIWCLMRQRDAETDSYNETADGHTAEKDKRRLYTKSEKSTAQTKV